MQKKEKVMEKNIKNIVDTTRKSVFIVSLYNYINLCNIHLNNI